MFEHILDWKLLSGSHKFPGPEGGTCINEAAIVAAGFKYKAVKSEEDCPRCFSRVISAYAIELNDRMPDDFRQRLLLPFVTRLHGTRDTPRVERARAELIVVRTVRDIMPVVLYAIGLKGPARRCAAVSGLADAVGVVPSIIGDCHSAVDAARAAAGYAAGYAARAAVAAGYAAAAVDAARAVAAADAVARAAGHAANATTAGYAAADAATAADAAKIWTIAVSILDEAICLGKQAEPMETALVIERMECAKVLA